MMMNSLKYASKLWLTTILFAPDLFVLGLLIFGGAGPIKLDSAIVLWENSCLMGLLFTPLFLPAILITHFFLAQKDQAVLQKKTTLFMVGLWLTALVFAALLFLRIPNVPGLPGYLLRIVLPYFLTLSICFYAYKLAPAPVNDAVKS